MKQYFAKPQQKQQYVTKGGDEEEEQEEYVEIMSKHNEELDDFIKDNYTWINKDIGSLYNESNRYSKETLHSESNRYSEETDTIIEYFIETNGELNFDINMVNQTLLEQKQHNKLSIGPNELITTTYPQTYFESVSLYNQLHNKPSIKLPAFVSTLQDITIKYLPTGAGLLSALCIYPHINTLKNTLPFLSTFDKLTVSMKLFVVIQDIAEFVKNVAVERKNLKREMKRLGSKFVDLTSQYVGYAAVSYAGLAAVSLPIGWIAVSFFISAGASNIFSMGVKSILHLNKDKIEILEEKQKQEQEEKEKRYNAIIKSLREGKTMEMAEKEYEDEKTRIFTKSTAKKIIVTMILTAISGAFVTQLLNYMAKFGTIGNVINYLSIQKTKKLIDSYLLNTLLKYAQVDQILNKIVDKTFDKKKQRLPNFCHKYLKKTKLTRWLTNICMNEIIKTILNGYIQQNLTKFGTKLSDVNVDNISQLINVISDADMVINMQTINDTLINIPNNVLTTLNDQNLSKVYNYIQSSVTEQINDIRDLFQVDFGEKFTKYISSLFILEPHDAKSGEIMNLMDDMQPDQQLNEAQIGANNVKEEQIIENNVKEEQIGEIMQNLIEETVNQRQMIENNIDKISQSINDIEAQITAVDVQIDNYKKINKITNNNYGYGTNNAKTNDILINSINILQTKKRILIGTKSQQNMLLSSESNRLDVINNIQQTLLQQDSYVLQQDSNVSQQNSNVLQQTQKSAKIISSMHQNIEKSLRTNTEINESVNKELTNLNFLVQQTSAEIIMINNELAMNTNIQQITHNFQFLLQNDQINELMNNENFLKNQLKYNENDIKLLQQLKEKMAISEKYNVEIYTEEQIQIYNKFITKINEMTKIKDPQTGEEMDMTTCIFNPHNTGCVRNSLLKNSMEILLKTYFYKHYAYLKIADKTIESIANISSVQLLTSDDLITILGDAGVDILAKFTSPNQAAEFISNITNFGKYNVADIQLELLTNPENYSIIIKFLNGELSKWDIITKLPQIIPRKMLMGF